MKKRALLALASAVLIASACSHQIESPNITVGNVVPDLVCNDKTVSTPLTNVELHGEGFTPLPSKTLEGKEELILPSIMIHQEEPLPPQGMMMGMTSPDVTIADDPAHPESSRVHWTSEELMSFDVQPADKLPTGVFSIVVTNPDQTHSTKFERGIGIVPKPIIAMLKPPAICDDQSDQKVEIDGAYFLSFDGKSPTVTIGMDPGAKTYMSTVDPMSCTPLMGAFKEKDVKVCTSLTITIPKGDFMVNAMTKLPVIVTNPAPADCASSDMIEITIDPPPKVDVVKPATVCDGGSQITIQGSNFQMGAKVSLDCGMGDVVDASSVMVTSDGMTITATFGPGASAGGNCDVVVTNPDGCSDRPLPHKTVAVVSGPILFFVDPPVVFNGINTRITLYATSITPPLPMDAVTIVPSGMNMPVTILATNPVANHPNRLQAIVPTGTAPGVYDVTLKDNSGCFATLPKAFTITKDLTVTIKNVIPPFGYTQDDTAVTIFRDTAAVAPMNQPFVDTPRVFLNPTNPQPTDVAVEVESVAFGDADKVTGVVPSGTPVHGYDVVLVNPDGSVGLLAAGFTEVANAPPSVDSVTPSSIINAAGQKVLVTGKNFDPLDKISLSCVDAAGNPVAAPPVAQQAPGCNAGICTQSATIDASGLAAGDVCILRVTNPDGSFGEYSAIGVTNSSLNLNSPVAGTDMNVGRRALAAASGNATAAARFVYAIGGDNGMAAGALDSTEFAPVDLFGKMGKWTSQLAVLGSKRTLAGAATVGRYIYLVGGDDGTGPLDTAERALILSPREAPVIDDVDLALQMKGLDAGDWHYKVAATFDPADTDNPGGTSLPSDEFSIRLPTIPNKKITVTVIWKAPVDSLKQPVPGVNGYKVYRTAKAGDPAGSEVLIGTVNGGNMLTFTDDGTAMLGTETPLPEGSTGNWAKLPSMATKRSSPAVVAGNDPAAPGTFYVYALAGKTGMSTVTGSYELLAVTTAANGRQTAAAAWTAGMQASGTGRWQALAWKVDGSVQSNYAPDTWIFLGGGLTGGGPLTGVVDAAKIQAGGQLTAFNDAGVKDFSATAAGYGVCAANQQLFVFGGASAAPSAQAKSAALFSNNNPTMQLPPPGLANNAWNNEGLSMTHGRYLMGSSVQSAFIFLLGGQTDEPSAASKTTELVIW